METYYARVMTRYGNAVHLTEVESRNRRVDWEDRITLCGHEVDSTMDGCSDELNCSKCKKLAAENPRRMR